MIPQRLEGHEEERRRNKLGFSLRVPGVLVVNLLPFLYHEEPKSTKKRRKK